MLSQGVIEVAMPHAIHVEILNDMVLDRRAIAIAGDLIALA